MKLRYNARALRKIAGIDLSDQIMRKQAQFRLPPSSEEYLQFLDDNQNVAPTIYKHFQSLPVDWEDIDELNSEGYVPAAPNTVDPMPMPDVEAKQYGNAAFYPDAMVVKTVMRNKGGKWQRPKSLLAHEIGHSRDLTDPAGIVAPSFVQQNKYPYMSLQRALEDPKIFNSGSSVDALTNGVSTSNMPDILKAEVNAWERAPGGYDPSIREAALASYRETVADIWRNYASTYFNNLYNGNSDDVSRLNVENWMRNQHKNTMDSASPEVREFWRTNTVESARKFIDELRKRESDREVRRQSRSGVHVVR